MAALCETLLGERARDLLPILGYVHQSRVAEAQRILAELAAPEPGDQPWSEPILRNLVDAISINAENLLIKLTDEAHTGRWVRSAQLGQELGLGPKQIGSAVTMIKREAAARNLASPLLASLRRGEDGAPARFLRLREEVADLIAGMRDSTHGPDRVGHSPERGTR